MFRLLSQWMQRPTYSFVCLLELDGFVISCRLLGSVYISLRQIDLKHLHMNTEI